METGWYDVTDFSTVLYHHINQLAKFTMYESLETVDKLVEGYIIIELLI